ncbi:MAG: NAD(P)-binding domain-containing protein [Acidobacteriaceae bacterium]|nr:NAD(P)-binding domain-containing protein [Acidobacteriaceae bacterium]
MNLGFVGTGEITSAMVTGLSSFGSDVHSIRLSPRNLEVATNLARRFPGVSIASSNQAVLDGSGIVVIAVKPPLVQSVLSQLHFRPDHAVISVVSGHSLESISNLVAPATRVIRAVPLPSTAKRIGPTAIYPQDGIAEEVFAAIGTVFSANDEHEFEAICAVTSTIATFYAWMAAISSWLTRNNVPASKAQEYVVRMFYGVTSGAVNAPEQDFQSLAASHATAGGINEQFLSHMLRSGTLDHISKSLDAVLARINAGFRK